MKIDLREPSHCLAILFGTPTAFYTTCLIYAVIDHVGIITILKWIAVIAVCAAGIVLICTIGLIVTVWGFFKYLDWLDKHGPPPEEDDLDEIPV